MTSKTAADRQDTFLRVTDLIDRWPIGRSSVYRLIKEPDFPAALVLLREKTGQVRSMGFARSDIEAYEVSHMVRLCELEDQELDALLGDEGPGEDDAASCLVSFPEAEAVPAVEEPGDGEPSRRLCRSQLPPSRRGRRPSTGVMD